MAFERFRNRVVLKAKLVAVTPIFIGARADSFKPGTINGSCVKDVHGRPYIPGSSLKGALRAFMSDVLGEPIDSKVNTELQTKNQRDKFQSPQMLADAVISKSTVTELLFGSQVMAGKVKIADALPVEKHISTEIRNGVAIDRDTRTAIGGALFDTEVVPSDTAFQFIASAENLNSTEADLFGRLMEHFAEGNITIGGRSRAGLGNVRLTDVVVTIYRAVSGSFPESKPIKCSQNQIQEAICLCSQD